jgi:hypothetical protein
MSRDSHEALEPALNALRQQLFMKLARILNKWPKAASAACCFWRSPFVLLATIVRSPPPPPPAGPADARLEIVAIALDEQDPRRRRVGELVFLRGWALSSPEPRFGGISAMQVENGQGDGAQ